MVLLTILLGVLNILFGPFLSFFLGWGVGWILNLIMGSWIIDGLALFNLNIAPETVPLFFAIVALIAAFFGVAPIPSKSLKER